MLAIVVKEQPAWIASQPWIIEIHNAGCECGCGAEEGKVGKGQGGWKGPRKIGCYKTKKSAQVDADRMNHIDHPWSA